MLKNRETPRPYRDMLLCLFAYSATIQSERPDLNRRSPGPRPGAMPGFATFCRRPREVDRSGLGGARILVSGSSDRRSTVSATSPNKKPDVAVTPGFHVSPAKSVAECHKRQWRRGCVFAG